MKGKIMLRKSSFSLAALILALACLQGCSRPREVAGQVFIVTNGGQNIRLGLVEVRAIPESEIKPFVAQKLKAAELQRPALEEAVTEARRHYEQAKANVRAAANDYMDADFGERMSALSTRFSREDTARDKLTTLNDAEGKLGFISAPEFFFTGLPQGVASARTDADGKFTLTVPRSGKYALAARAQREVFGSTEFYYWLVWVEADGTTKSILSNTNLMVANSPDTVVAALDPVITKE
jgi:hypothetical protein